LLIFKEVICKSSHKPKAFGSYIYRSFDQKNTVTTSESTNWFMGMRADIFIGILIINLCELFLPNPFDALLLQKILKQINASIERNTLYILQIHLY
jgi:hypothetical protein